MKEKGCDAARAEKMASQEAESRIKAGLRPAATYAPISSQ